MTSNLVIEIVAWIVVSNVIVIVALIVGLRFLYEWLVRNPR